MMIRLPYLLYKSKIYNDCAKVGYYKNLHNNVKSLIEYPKKVDHSVNAKAKTKGREQDKDLGIHAKDISDSHCGAVTQMFQDVGGYSITYNYDSINRKITMLRDTRQGIRRSSFDKKMSYQEIMSKIATKKHMF